MTYRRPESVTSEGFQFRIRNGLLLMCAVEATLGTLFVVLLWAQLRSPQASLWIIAVWAFNATRALTIGRPLRKRGTAHWAASDLLLANIACSAVLWGGAWLLVHPGSAAIAQVTATLGGAAIGAAACGFVPGGGLVAAVYLIPIALGTAGALFSNVALCRQTAVLALVFLAVAAGVEFWTRRLIGASTSLSTQLLEAKRAAEKASAVKSSIIANTSHELRTPLNAVIGFAEAISQQILGPIGNTKYLDYANSIRDSGRHLLQIINDILDISRIESGKHEMNESYVPVAEAVDFAIRMVQDGASKAGVAVVNTVPLRAPSLIADERMLKQIILNLLSNAVKFTPMGGRVTVSAGTAANGHYYVAIEDSGIGIPTEDIERVFEPFVQIEGAFNRRHQGTGLGLALVRAMVELHQAHLGLESELGRGTIARVSFPISRVIYSDSKPQELARAG